MTTEREQEIIQAIIRAIAGFGVDFQKSYQSMGVIALAQMRRDIPRDELLEVLKSMEGVVFLSENSRFEVQVPTHYFIT